MRGRGVLGCLGDLFWYYWVDVGFGGHSFFYKISFTTSVNSSSPSVSLFSLPPTNGIF